MSPLLFALLPHEVKVKSTGGELTVGEKTTQIPREISSIRHVTRTYWLTRTVHAQKWLDNNSRIKNKEFFFFVLIPYNTIKSQFLHQVIIPSAKLYKMNRGSRLLQSRGSTSVIRELDDRWWGHASPTSASPTLASPSLLFLPGRPLHPDLASRSLSLAPLSER